MLRDLSVSPGRRPLDTCTLFPLDFASRWFCFVIFHYNKLQLWAWLYAESAQQIIKLGGCLANLRHQLASEVRFKVTCDSLKYGASIDIWGKRCLGKGRRGAGYGKPLGFQLLRGHLRDAAAAAELLSVVRGQSYLWDLRMPDSIPRESARWVPKLLWAMLKVMPWLLFSTRDGRRKGPQIPKGKWVKILKLCTALSSRWGGGEGKRVTLGLKAGAKILDKPEKREGGNTPAFFQPRSCCCCCSSLSHSPSYPAF